MFAISGKVMSDIENIRDLNLAVVRYIHVSNIGQGDARQKI
jgi:hypothetical protein